MKPQVSIIVPIYNAEATLKDCIDSVVTQTLTNWELLLVDDGSSDSSLQICNIRAKSDRRIKVYSAGHSGVSNARNLALKHATGEYIIMLDADDYWLNSNMLNELVNLAEEREVDMVRFEYQAVDNDHNHLFDSPYISQRRKCIGQVLSSSKIISDLLLDEDFLCLWLIRKKILNEKSFCTSMNYLEDMDLLFSILSDDVKAVYTAEPMYAYRQSSTSASWRISYKHIYSSFFILERLLSYSKKTGAAKMIKDIYYRIFNRYLIAMKLLSTKEYHEMYSQLNNEVNLNKIRHDIVHGAYSSHLIPPVICLLPAQLCFRLFSLYRILKGINR